MVEILDHEGDIGVIAGDFFEDEVGLLEGVLELKVEAAKLTVG